MTEAQAAWLRKLRDEGPQNGKIDHGSAMVSLRKVWAAPDEDGWPYHKITPEGLAALALYENGESK